LLKERIFDRLSDAGFGVRKKSKSRNTSSRELLLGSSPIIDANFVEVDEGSSRDPDSSPEKDSGSIDSELLENLREYLRTRSQEEISEIFEEVRKILERRGSESNFRKELGEEIPINQRARIKDISKNVFKVFLETASYGGKRIISASKTASSIASSIASERKESIVDSSKKLNEKWNNLSPRDRKIITELLVAMIEIALLKGASRSKQAAFAILSSISRHQTPGRNDLEDFTEGLQKLFKRRH
jgi:predicted house-cleaning noncanonical NTP pyrophosphatase (MazG superfamily)